MRKGGPRSLEGAGKAHMVKLPADSVPRSTHLVRNYLEGSSEHAIVERRIREVIEVDGRSVRLYAKALEIVYSLQEDQLRQA
jgi:hypothetical protein